MQTIADISPDTRALADALAATPIGGVATYDTLTTALGRRPPPYLIYSALKLANREVGAVFECVRKVGYKRLSAEEIPTVGHAARRRIRRAARTASKRMANGAFRANDLPPDLQRRLNAEQSALGLLEHIARDQPTKAQEDDRVYPTARAAEAFMRHIGARLPAE